MSSVNKNPRHAQQSCVRLCVQKSLGYMFTIFDMYACTKKDGKFSPKSANQFFPLFTAASASAYSFISLTQLSLNGHSSLRERFIQG